MAAATSSRGTFRLLGALPRVSRRGSDFRARTGARWEIGATICLASHELKRSSINSTRMPRAFSTRAANAFTSSDISLGVPSRCSGSPTTMQRTPCLRASSRKRARSRRRFVRVQVANGREVNAVLVGERQSQSFLPVVDRENHSGGSRSGNKRRSAEGKFHEFLL